MDDHKKQTEFDYENQPAADRRRSRRSTHRRDIERLEIESPPVGWRRRIPSPAVLRAVLLAIDSFVRDNDGWRLKNATIAERAGFSDPGTAQRAVAWLCELGLITVQRTGRSSWFTMNRAAIRQAGERGAPPRSQEGRAPITNRQRPEQNGAAPLSTLAPPKTHTQPPTPETDQWAGVAVALFALGIYPKTVGQLLETLPDQTTPANVDAIIAHWQTFEPGTPNAGYAAGALVERLRASRSEEDAAAGWPPPSEAYSRHRANQSSIRQRLETSREGEAAASQAAADRQRARDLEKQRGPELDALPAAEREALAAQLFADSFTRSRYRQTWQTPGSHCRGKLLEALSCALDAR